MLSDDKMQGRRGFLVDGMRSIAKLLSDALSETVVTAGSGGKRYLRPPGAIDEAAFLFACTRCGDCVTACPVHAIKLLPPAAGAAVGTPFIDPMSQPCDLCGKCMPACEPKALHVIENPRQVRMGTAVIDPTTCWAHKGAICDLCYQRCPFPDEAIRMVGGKPEILSDACTGCGLCAYVCVSTPASIQILPKN